MIGESSSPAAAQVPPELADRPVTAVPPIPAQAEVGGREGPEPTRYGDWEKNGRCIDF
jgi:hypothetical protein